MTSHILINSNHAHWKSSKILTWQSIFLEFLESINDRGRVVFLPVCLKNISKFNISVNEVDIEWTSKKFSPYCRQLAFLSLTADKKLTYACYNDQIILNLFMLKKWGTKINQWSFIKKKKVKGDSFVHHNGVTKFEKKASAQVAISGHGVMSGDISGAIVRVTRVP